MTRALALGLVALLSAGFTLPPAAADHPGGGLPVWGSLPDVESEPRPYEEAAAPALSTEGPRVVVHFSLEDVLNEPQTILYLETPDGDPVLHIVGYESSHVYASDGYDEDGTPRPAVPLGLTDTAARRLDVRLEGDHYTVDAEEPDGPRTLRAFHAATVAASNDTAHPPSAIIHRLSFYPATAALENFRRAPFDDAWTPHDPVSALAVEDNFLGHWSAGRLLIDTEGNLKDLAYTHAPLDAYDGRYVAEASARPVRLAIDDGVPDHQAVLAGLSGPLDHPTVNWAIVMAPVNCMDAPTDPNPRCAWGRWSLFHIDADGHRTQVAPALDVRHYWAVRAFVDEDAGTLAVQLDDADAVKVFGGGLPASDRVAVGDVWQDHTWWTGARSGHYDNLAVLPWTGDQ